MENCQSSDEESSGESNSWEMQTNQSARPPRGIQTPRRRVTPARIGLLQGAAPPPWGGNRRGSNDLHCQHAKFAGMSDDDSISRSSMSGGKSIIVRTKANAAQMNSKVIVEGDEKIAEEEAICKFCSDFLTQNKAHKLICGCRGCSLAHKECALGWFSEKAQKTCDLCEQGVQFVPVALISETSSSVAEKQRDGGKKPLLTRLFRKS